MIDFVDMSVLESLKGWQLDRALTTAEERLQLAREELHSLTQWGALQEDLQRAEDEVSALAACKGKLRAEFARRWPNGIPIGY